MGKKEKQIIVEVRCMDCGVRFFSTDDEDHDLVTMYLEHVKANHLLSTRTIKTNEKSKRSIH